MEKIIWPVCFLFVIFLLFRSTTSGDRHMEHQVKQTKAKNKTNAAIMRTRIPDARQAEQEARAAAIEARTKAERETHDRALLAPFERRAQKAMEEDEFQNSLNKIKARRRR
jgi:uncharacterized membrane protein